MSNKFRTIVALALGLPAVGVVASVAQPDQPAQAASEVASPVRVLDTRSGLGARRGVLDRGDTLRLVIPQIDVSGDTVALVNLTSEGASQPGHIVAWPCADDKPTTSILNFEPGRAVANMAALGYTDAGLCFSSTSAVNLIVDLTGVARDGELHGVAPHRLVDTRSSRPVSAGVEYRVDVAGSPGIPNSATGAGVNVTAVTPPRDGFIVVKPCGSKTDASTINFLAGEVVPHFTFTGLSSGDLCVVSTVDTDIIVDSFVWIDASGDLRTSTPARLLDTRTGKGGTSGARQGGNVVRFRVAGESGIPNDASGVTVNVVAVNAADFGFVTVWPCDADQPNSSTLNFWPGAVRSNQATIKLSASGDLCLFTRIAGSSRLDLVVDAVGYVDGEVDRSPPPVTTPPPPLPEPPTPTGRFVTMPPGSPLPSGAECSTRVRPTAEIRPENATANNTRGSRANANNRTDWSGFDRVDGDFAGTTDEIIQWAACKWGIDEDMVRAQVVKESWWKQSANGDNGESWGLGQVRDTAHRSAFEYSINARNSSAYNLDYTYATWRACYEGVYTWLNTVERGAQYGPGDAWGCFGVWFSGRWYTQPAINYLEDGPTNGYGNRGVKTHYSLRTWEEPDFINS